MGAGKAIGRGSDRVVGRILLVDLNERGRENPSRNEKMWNGSDEKRQEESRIASDIEKRREVHGGHSARTRRNSERSVRKLGTKAVPRRREDADSSDNEG